MLYNYSPENETDETDDRFTEDEVTLNTDKRTTDPRIETFKNAVEVLRKLKQTEK